MRLTCAAVLFSITILAGSIAFAQTAPDPRSMKAIVLAQAGRWTPQQQKTFRNLPHQEQERIKKNFRKFQQLPPDRRQKLKNQYKQWQQMPSERREKLKNTFKQLKRMPPNKRRHLQESFRER